MWNKQQEDLRKLQVPLRLIADQEQGFTLIPLQSRDRLIYAQHASRLTKTEFSATISDLLQSANGYKPSAATFKDSVDLYLETLLTFSFALTWDIPATIFACQLPRLWQTRLESSIVNYVLIQIILFLLTKFLIVLLFYVQQMLWRYPE